MIIALPNDTQYLFGVCFINSLRLQLFIISNFSRFQNKVYN